MVELVVFVIAGGACLAGAIGVVTSRNPVHAALSLVATLFGIAVLFVALNGFDIYWSQTEVAAGPGDVTLALGGTGFQPEATSTLPMSDVGQAMALPFNVEGQPPPRDTGGPAAAVPSSGPPAGPA
mgnify:CR=1 FL=1